MRRVYEKVNEEEKVPRDLLLPVYHHTRTRVHSMKQAGHKLKTGIYFPQRSIKGWDLWPLEAVEVESSARLTRDWTSFWSKGASVAVSTE